MKMTLVSIHVEKSPPSFPLAAAMLKTALCADGSLNGNNISLAEFYLPADPKAAAKEILSTSPDVAGFTVCIWNAAACIQIASELKRISPGIITIAGGPQATAAAEDIADSGVFSYIVRGEGETVLPELIRSITDGKSETSIILDSEASDLSAMHSPYEYALTNDRGREGILWELSRGCPFNCSFCYESRGDGSVRNIKPERIIEELKLFRKKGVERIWVLDPTFNYNRSRAEEILRLIIKYCPDAHYTFEIRAELMSIEICELLAEIDSSLQIGLQTVNSDALVHLNRSFSRKKFKAGCRMMSDFGLSFGIDLIYGLPGDSFDAFCESIDFAVGCVPNNIDIFPLSVLPGTELYDKADKLSLRHSGFPDYELISNSSFPESDLQRAAEITAACDALYNREQSFAWFSAAADAVGMRPSALFAAWANRRSDDIPAFLSGLFKKADRVSLFPPIENFIIWSRTAEAAYCSPGDVFRVKLLWRPEILDELSSAPAEMFLKRHPKSVEKTYSITYDGEELYIN